MKEILGVAEQPQTRRRWFHDEYFDLFVWQTAAGEVLSFQLCYGAAASEQALVWNRESGFFHDGPDPRSAAGEGREPLLARFDTAASDLPEDVRALLRERVREYLRKTPAVPSRRKHFRRADWQKLESETR
jgi:hypothetical protein